ncbi:MAG TPA: thioredoxin family protein [Fimbriimonas sp.]|nr:thioredoxin family protein [Fimbriimonas sp.]
MKHSVPVGRFASFTLAAICLSATIIVAQERAIYPEKADAKTEIQRALIKAGKEKKRVILDFGGNWCGDCRVLDAHFHKEPNSSLLAKSFILIDVNIGHGDMNLDIAKKYGVPLEKGVPALAVLDAKGQVLYSQKNGEFESMRSMDPASVTAFLKRWKG